MEGADGGKRFGRKDLYFISVHANRFRIQRASLKRCQLHAPLFIALLVSIRGTDPVYYAENKEYLNVFFSILRIKLDIEIWYQFLDPYALNPFLLCLVRICIVSLYRPRPLVFAMLYPPSILLRWGG